MTPPSLKGMLASRQVSIGSWITLAHPAIAEIMSAAGFDWLAVDLEHSVITVREMEELVRIISCAGSFPLVRLTGNDQDLIKRVMDAGAHGVIVPMIKSKEEAERAVRSVYYPPRGQRGVGLARAQKYGADFEGYRSWLEREGVVIVQIEHIDAVRHLKAILEVNGVDGFLIGPYDLSASLGYPGQFDHPEVVSALAEIQSVSHAVGKPGGIHVVEPNPEEFRRQLDQGYTFLAYSLDIRMLDAACREGLRKGANR